MADYIFEKTADEILHAPNDYQSILRAAGATRNADDQLPRRQGSVPETQEGIIYRRIQPQLPGLMCERSRRETIKRKIIVLLKYAATNKFSTWITLLRRLGLPKNDWILATAFLVLNGASFLPDEIVADKSDGQTGTPTAEANDASHHLASTQSAETGSKSARESLNETDRECGADSIITPFLNVQLVERPPPIELQHLQRAMESAYPLLPAEMQWTISDALLKEEMDRSAFDSLMQHYDALSKAGTQQTILVYALRVGIQPRWWHRLICCPCRKWAAFKPAKEPIPADQEMAIDLLQRDLLWMGEHIEVKEEARKSIVQAKKYTFTIPSPVVQKTLSRDAQAAFDSFFITKEKIPKKIVVITEHPAANGATTWKVKFPAMKPVDDQPDQVNDGMELNNAGAEGQEHPDRVEGDENNVEGQQLEQPGRVEGDENNVEGQQLEQPDCVEGDENNAEAQQLEQPDCVEGDENNVEGQQLEQPDCVEGDENNAEGQQLEQPDCVEGDENNAEGQEEETPEFRRELASMHREIYEKSRGN